ncbi:hypothetical protein JNUCC0626_18395 [Lentzea sp. JNUCC 0626]|uniref:hypothetical protein n=1 Tax=Lentzea sp. JNUCC 0626 TaxID=3367513 RepID=UPI00374818D7
MSAPKRPEAAHTKVLRAVGSGSLIGFLIAALAAWSWVCVALAVGIFVGTAVVDLIWDGIDQLRG